MSGRNIIGIILVLLGVGFLLDRMGIWGFSASIGLLWPTILILIGCIQLAKRSISTFGGILVIVIGVILQLRQLDYLPGNFSEIFWPTLIVLVGLYFIFGKRLFPSYENTEDTMNHFVVFSGLNTHSTSSNFKGGSVTALFGGAEIDLRQANLKEDKVVLDLTAIFGGIDIRVPEHWNVQASGLPLFGGYDNKTAKHAHDANVPTLKIRCLATFGGVDIKN